MTPNHMNRSGVYSIRNKLNGKRYIGSTVRFRSRWTTHLRELRRGIHSNLHLQSAWNKYGEEVFEFKFLMFCPGEECTRQEARLIQKYKATDPKFGYNVCAVGSNRLGVKSSLVTRGKMSEAHKRPEIIAIVRKTHCGKTLSESHRAVIRELNRTKMTDKIREKISKTKKGVPWTEARRLAQLRRKV